MDWDGSGGIDRTYFPEDDRDDDIAILASKFETFMATLATSLENCYTLDSQTTPTANLGMNSKKITSLANGTVSTDAINLSQISGKLDSVVGGTNITIDDTDANNPIINATSDFAGGNANGVLSYNSTTVLDITAFKGISNDGTTNIEISAGSLTTTTDADWASGTAPSLTSTEVNVWADYNSGTERFIFDDATGSNIVGAKTLVGAVTTDGSDFIREFDLPINASTGQNRGSRQHYIYRNLIVEASDVTSQTLTLKAPSNASYVDLEFNMQGGSNDGTSTIDIDSVYGNWADMSTKFEGADWSQENNMRDMFPIDSTKFLEIIKSGVNNTNGYVRNYGYIIER